jgi:hypothetical protein
LRNMVYLKPGRNVVFHYILVIHNATIIFYFVNEVIYLLYPLGVQHCHRS